MEAKAIPVGVPVGILGGTFNPIHHGHLILARAAKEALGLSRMLLVPNARSPLRQDEELAPADLRLRMLEAAVSGEEGLEACGVEVRRKGTSYTVDTLRELNQAHPDARLHFLVGADSLETLDRWVRIDEIIRLAAVVVLPRPGADAPALLRDLGERAPEVAKGVRLLDLNCRIEISATGIRERVAAGQSIRWLVPDAVREIIESQGLYRL
ncbi:MAG: nicotinate (nicotinamide) nucleotide adenylyltransferase [Verrucomicrobia bacterium]|nr:nicotinate (nicotinamide) nucleotide adenylyltransferase [Verrucomicrobiota bacterium]MCH8513301.1 nicotinate-nucleotide adenylyltransferase [Kiritimatiellia bacterium]